MKNGIGVPKISSVATWVILTIPEIICFAVLLLKVEPLVQFYHNPVKKSIEPIILLSLH